MTLLKKRTYSQPLLSLLQRALLSCVLALGSSCVGTIEEAKEDSNIQFEGEVNFFAYSGLRIARPIAHDKVELEFDRYSGNEVEYFLQINDSKNPLKLDQSTLSVAPGNRLLYTVKGLNVNTSYKFKVSAKLPPNLRSQNENQLTAKTFDNLVSNFDGVLNLTLMPGNTSGGIVINWKPVTMAGLFSAGPYDPVHYEVTLISEIGGIQNLNNPLYTGTDRIVRFMPEHPAKAGPFTNPSSLPIENLSPARTYFVQVRAINQLWDFLDRLNTVPMPVSREMNTRTLSIRTDSNAGFFAFNQNSLILNNPPGAAAFNTINAFWAAASGPFAGYKLVWRKYEESGNPQVDDQLNDTWLADNIGDPTFSFVNASTTSRTVSSLDSNSWYQFKVVMCKVVTCPLDPADPNVSIVSNMRAIQVRPNLSQFYGIHTIGNPGEFSARDLVTLHFDSPILSSGFASVLEFYCVNPENKSQMVRFDGTNPITGSSISRCNGLSLQSVATDISSQTSQKISGLAIDGTREYCFAATPAILSTPEVRLTPAQMIVRCSIPEIIPPSNLQFLGISGNCQINQTQATVGWQAPTGGVYSNFRVFWREKTSSAKFNFQDAINDTSNTNYQASALLPLAQLSFQLPALEPGKNYLVGVLAVADMEAPVPTLYSEFNSSVRECNIPMPKATFKGFTRVLALGPKVDGRIPNANPVNFHASSFQYEAINAEGIPYEVPKDLTNQIITSPRPELPPGRDSGTDFASAFDGRPNQDGLAISNRGIISLAWEEINLDMTQAQSSFVSNQASTSRSNRRWGYRVYRSDDNRLTWQLLSSPIFSNNIYSQSYTYTNSFNNSQVTTRMAFFTDYSVQAMDQIHTNGKDLERARVYFYRIVPVYNNIELNVENTGTNIIKVTLPPPNMALVHRWMANRAGCMELRKDFNITQNYSCEYGGLGARPAKIPHQINFTNLDQGADLLIDRFELGCRYTRGDNTSSPRAGLSNFLLDGAARRNLNDQNFYPLFRGKATFDETETASNFRGCAGQNLNVKIGDNQNSYAPGVLNLNFTKNLHGDCLGFHLESIATSTCTAENLAANRVTFVPYSTPGTFGDATMNDCSQELPNFPTTRNTKYSYQYASNQLLQAEPLAVFHNGEMTRGYPLPFWTPDAAGAPESTKQISTLNGDYAASCWINLSAVDGSGYVRPRWVDLQRQLVHQNQTKYLMDMTVSEVLATSDNGDTFYNGADTINNGRVFRTPRSTLNSQRVSDSSKIARLMTSNAARLPPVGGLSFDRASRLCNNYHVQTGFSQNGSLFIPLEAEKSKRLLARTEFVAAAQWPETLNQASILQREQSTTAANNMCNNFVRNINSTGVWVGQHIRANQYYNLPRTPIATGSSPEENGQLGLINTALCSSRYGIQDLIGNSSELSSDTLFCDYSQDRALLGPALSTWSTTNSTNVAEAGPQIPIATTFTEQYNTRFHQNSRFTFRNGDPAMTIRPHVQTSTDSGYCSFTDNLSARRAPGVNPFRDVSGIFRPIFNSNGTLNTSLITADHLVPEVLPLSRNGDGRFYDLGPNSLAPALKFTDSLNFTTPATAAGKYFNPVMGVSLSCGNGSCEDLSLDADSRDNTKTTTSILNLNRGSSDPSPEISNFFIGNSNFTNPGMSVYQITPEIVDTDRPQDFQIIEEVRVDDPVSFGDMEIIRRPASFYQPAETVNVYGFTWQINRNARIQLLNGGQASSTNTGRYTGQLTEWTRELSYGVRCSVRINEE